LLNILKCPSQLIVVACRSLYDYLKLFTDKLTVDITWRATASNDSQHISL